MKQDILEVLYMAKEEIKDYQGNDMIEDNIIDSHDIFNIVVELEERFKIEIDPEYIVPEYFKNADSLLALVMKIKNAQQVGG